LVFLRVYFRLLRNTATAATAMMMTTAAMAMYSSVVGKPFGSGTGEGVTDGVGVGIDVGATVGAVVGATIGEAAEAADTPMAVSAYDDQ